MSAEEKEQANQARRDYADLHSQKEGPEYERLGLLALEQRFAQIFKKATFALGLEAVTFHLLEEVGEVVEALTSLYTYEADDDTPLETLRQTWEDRRFELEEELADSLSWLFAVSAKFREVFEVFDAYTDHTTTYALQMNIASHLGKRHRSQSDGQMRCFKCGGDECSCTIKLVLDNASANSLTGRGL